MTIKYNRLLLTITLTVITMLSGVVLAENVPAGTWYVYPIYSNPPQKVIDTENIVYYTVNGNLFSYDKKAGESYSFTTQNRLNDNFITNIFYNFPDRRLAVCYSNGNIDLLADDGSVMNLSDIRDSSIDPPVTINAVAFDGDFMYVATAFGVVKFNIKRGEVVTSGNYGKTVNGIVVIGDRLVIHTDKTYYYIDKNAALNSLDKYTKLYGGDNPREIINVDGSDSEMIVLLDNANYTLGLHTIDFNANKQLSLTSLTSVHSVRPTYLMHSKDGAVYYEADSRLYTLDENNREKLLAELSDQWASAKFGTSTGIGSLWVLGNEGLANFSLDGEGGITMNMDFFRPDAFPVAEVRYFYPSADGKRLYAQNSGITAYRFGGATRGLDKPQTAGYIDLTTGDIVNVTAYPVEATVSIAKNSQRTYGKYAISPSGLAEVPSDPASYFLATGDDGIYKITDGEVVGRYGHLNCPIKYIDNRDIFYGLSIDRGGNLWAMRYADGSTFQPLIVLPADKVRLDPDDVTADDWIELDLSNVGYMSGMDAQFIHCRQSNISFMSSTGTKKILAYDNRGTLNNFNDDRYVLIEKMVDQDGKEFTPQFINCFVEDNNGKVWVGTITGIVEINPKSTIGQTTEVHRLKVPRNDGTNLADYLLGTDNINDIAVDGANRKWIATSVSGLFVVSPEGNEIIANFTQENSPLTTNYINALYVDQSTGIVYIGTDHGLFSYASDVTPPKENYDDILVYPNPVKPEFRGRVTISGLMDNSLVKIADSAGSVIYQGRSEGGKFFWNCCNSAGARVKSGVYYVMASQNASGAASAAVAKIMVVN